MNASRSKFRGSLAAWWFVCCFASVALARAQEDLTTLFPIPEKKRSVVSGEVIREGEVVLSDELAFAFKKGPDAYLVLKPEYASLLTQRPAIETPPGLHVEILGLDAAPTGVKVATPVGEGVAKGFRIACRARVRADSTASPGRQSVFLRFVAVPEIAAAMEATDPTEAPTCEFALTVYESLQARQEAEAEKKRQRQAKVDEEWRRVQNLWIKVLCVIAAVIALGAAGSYLFRWLAPTYSIDVGSGESASIMGKLTRREQLKDPAKATGLKPYYEVCEARTFWATKANVRVVVEGVGGKSRLEQVTWESDDGFRTTVQSIEYEAIYDYEVRITATAGRGTNPGWFLAKTEAGYVRICVK